MLVDFLGEERYQRFRKYGAIPFSRLLPHMLSFYLSSKATSLGINPYLEIELILFLLLSCLGPIMLDERGSDPQAIFEERKTKRLEVGEFQFREVLAVLKKELDCLVDPGKSQDKKSYRLKLGRKSFWQIVELIRKKWKLELVADEKLGKAKLYPSVDIAEPERLKLFRFKAPYRYACFQNEYGWEVELYCPPRLGKMHCLEASLEFRDGSKRVTIACNEVRSYANFMRLKFIDPQGRKTKDRAFSRALLKLKSVHFLEWKPVDLGSLAKRPDQGLYKDTTTQFQLHTLSTISDLGVRALELVYSSYPNFISPAQIELVDSDGKSLIHYRMSFHASDEKPEILLNGKKHSAGHSKLSFRFPEGVAKESLRLRVLLPQKRALHSFETKLKVGLLAP